MGSSLGPIIANIFMDDFECKYMDQLSMLGVKSWLRYVDDTFVVLKNKADVDKVLSFLNDKHDTIKFTVENEAKNSLNFLDMKIKRNEDLTISLSTYRKPTFTGTMLNWNSLTSMKYKKGLINCLLYRSYSICSSIEQFEFEKSDIKQILINNNFPSYIIDLEFENFVKYRMINKLDKEVKSVAKERFLSLPYINDKSELIGSRIQNLVKEHFSNTKLTVAYKSPSTIGAQFPFKDKSLNKHNRSNVVYKLKCKLCNATYIGKTTRSCNIRMNEHQFTDKQSHVYTHNKLEGHEIDFNNVEILDSADNDNKLCWKEMLYIRQHKPTLNTQDELFTLIIRNVQLESSITRDIQKYLKTNKKTTLAK